MSGRRAELDARRDAQRSARMSVDQVMTLFAVTSLCAWTSGSWVLRPGVQRSFLLRACCSWQFVYRHAQRSCSTDCALLRLQQVPAATSRAWTRPAGSRVSDPGVQWLVCETAARDILCTGTPRSLCRQVPCLDCGCDRNLRHRDSTACRRFLGVTPKSPADL